MSTALQKEVRHDLLVETADSVSELIHKGLTFEQSYKQACAERHLSEEEIRDFRRKVGILLKARWAEKKHAGSTNEIGARDTGQIKRKTVQEEQIPLFGGNTYLD